MKWRKLSGRIGNAGWRKWHPADQMAGRNGVAMWPSYVSTTVAGLSGKYCGEESCVYLKIS